MARMVFVGVVVAFMVQAPVCVRHSKSEAIAMQCRVLLVSLLAGAMVLSVLTAGEQPRQSASRGRSKDDQVREEERLEQQITAITSHCQKMLDMQIELCKGTKGLHKLIEATTDKKPRPT